jgi:hypothetical protein
VIALRSAKVLFSLSEKLCTEKYPSSRFNHLSTTSASIWPSNKGISKFNYTFKGATRHFDEDALPVCSRPRICVKLSIISFICRAKASLSNNLKESPTLSTLISSTMRGHRDRQGQSYKGSTTSSPNSLFPEFVGDMHRETDKEQTALIPLI